MIEGRCKKHQKTSKSHGGEISSTSPQPTSCTGQPNGRWGRMKHLGYRNPQPLKYFKSNLPQENQISDSRICLGYSKQDANDQALKPFLLGPQWLHLQTHQGGHGCAAAAASLPQVPLRWGIDLLFQGGGQIGLIIQHHLNATRNWPYLSIYIYNVYIYIYIYRIYRIWLYMTMIASILHWSGKRSTKDHKRYSRKIALQIHAEFTSKCSFVSVEVVRPHGYRSIICFQIRAARWQSPWGCTCVCVYSSVRCACAARMLQGKSHVSTK